MIVTDAVHAQLGSRKHRISFCKLAAQRVTKLTSTCVTHTYLMRQGLRERLLLWLKDVIVVQGLYVVPPLAVLGTVYLLCGYWRAAAAVSKTRRSSKDVSGGLVAKPRCCALC